MRISEGSILTPLPWEELFLQRISMGLWCPNKTVEALIQISTQPRSLPSDFGPVTLFQPGLPKLAL